MRSVSASCMSVAFLLALPGDGFAKGAGEEEAAVVILVSMTGLFPQEAWAEAERRIRAELSALNLKVEVFEGVEKGERERRLELGKVAEERSAACAVRILRASEGSGGGVDLWINDRVTQKTVFRHLRLEGKTDSEAAAIAALRTVEALRASLMELKLSGGGRRGMRPPSQIVKLVESVRPAEEEGPVGLLLGAGGLGSPGRAGSMGTLHLALGWRPVPDLSLQIEGALSVLGSDVEERGSRASFDLAAIRAWGLMEVLDLGPLRLSLGIGGGMVIVWSKGEVSDRYDSREDRTVVGYIGSCGRIGLALTGSLRVQLVARLGALLPEAEILFPKEGKVLGFGRPLIEGFAAVELKLP